MEQNPNEETVDVNASPQQPEAKDTLETTDDMDSQASVKMEGSTEADTSASKARIYRPSRPYPARFPVR